MRLIDADALIDALDKSAIYGWSLEEDEAAHTWAERVVELMPAAEPEQQWIPCSKWLPKEGESAILRYSNGKISGGRYIGNRVWDVDYGDSDKTVSVIAWMWMPNISEERDSDE